MKLLFASDASTKNRHALKAKGVVEAKEDRHIPCL
jgi:hypothetical protein